MTASRTTLRSRVAALLATALLCACGARASASPDDVQPTPPRQFFGEPDSVVREQIEKVIESSFGDVNKAASGRELILHRFGLAAVPQLLDRIRSGANESIVRNAILMIATLRREKGASTFLWPAIPVLTSVITNPKPDPWRRVFAALALGTFYGPETARRSPASRDGTAAGKAAAEKALAEASQALLRSLGDADFNATAAASFALGKIGGMAAAAERGKQLDASPLPASPLAHVADLLSVGLLPTGDDRLLSRRVGDGERRIRAAAALAMACWAVGEAVSAPSGELAARAAARAQELDSFLKPAQNAALREDIDGAEALFARGMLALVSGRMETWDELFEKAMVTTDRLAAVALAQALVFAPKQSPARARLAEFLTHEGIGRDNANRAPIIAAALLVAGTDGTDRGVDACRAFLRDASREPRGKADYDVRFHAAIGLLRALAAGRVSPEKRETAVKALVEALKALPAAAETFRAALRDVAKSLEAALQNNPDARPTLAQVASVEAAFVDPDALTARDTIDVVVHRLNHALTEVFSLNNLPQRIIVMPDKTRVPNKEKQELFLLDDWLGRYPYFTRLDLLRDRGREPAPPDRVLGDDEIDR
jgi:hypothetical protein